jgi:hypothetical protein
MGMEMGMGMGMGMHNNLLLRGTVTWEKRLGAV